METKAKTRIKINELLNSVNWIFAKTMPEIPHEYIVIDWYPEKIKEIKLFIQEIDRNGYSSKFYSKENKYLNIDEYKYWVIDNIINRTKL